MHPFMKLYCHTVFSKRITFCRKKKKWHTFRSAGNSRTQAKEAVEEFIKSGGALGTTIGPKGFADANMDSDNMQKQMQSEKFEQETQKLWLRMRNEVIQELQEKGVWR
jgi:hypothetical protein